MRLDQTECHCLLEGSYPREVLSQWPPPPAQVMRGSRLRLAELSLHLVTIAVLRLHLAFDHLYKCQYH